MKFSKQLQKIMHHFGLSTTELADKILVPKATISHLISERNKPSLEFIMKLHTTFPTLNLEWLIYEKEPFLVTEIYPKSIEKDQNKIPVLNEISEVEMVNEIENEDQNESQPEEIEPKNINQNITENPKNILSFQSKEIDCIVIFYNDGSFKKYNP
ncbi:helix-turn-helix domain-containing protein [Paenimyroides baculatum]|uniref:Helix-turn-helix transcriptional regulator n=1 Tax=Paenimyroides baculatum TaxID=2608000 RepID=A0A5M6CM55_9FLAO|nr:helix-turn-helix transcriptional regulator [Paenimyroides baculatum]KAA5534395.1 helix-turn-helix transcriptional regulator [Paenimyroides baculatum]